MNSITKNFRLVMALILMGTACSKSPASQFLRLLKNSVSHTTKRFLSTSRLFPSLIRMKNISSFKRFCTASVIGAGVVTTQTKSFLSDDRPNQLKMAIDEAFEHNRPANDKDWRNDGSFGFYGLLALNEEHLLHNLINETAEKQDIYIIDVGCAQAGWGQEAMEVLLNHEPSKKSGKHFHIFSITGGNECTELVHREGHVTLYQLNQFKIENIDEELAKRGFNLVSKVDLIVSNWTLRHLVDPFGTLKRMYRLLTPTQGKLLSNGFLFMLQNSEKVQAFPCGNESILSRTNATLLFRRWDAGGDVGQFLISRSNDNDLEIPLQYTGAVQRIGHNWQNANGLLTVYDSNPSERPFFEREYIEESPWEHYCNEGDQPCKNLYTQLAQKKLFYCYRKKSSQK